MFLFRVWKVFWGFVGLCKGLRALMAECSGTGLTISLKGTRRTIYPRGPSVQLLHKIPVRPLQSHLKPSNEHAWLYGKDKKVKQALHYK